MFPNEILLSSGQPPWECTANKIWEGKSELNYWEILQTDSFALSPCCPPPGYGGVERWTPVSEQVWGGMRTSEQIGGLHKAAQEWSRWKQVLWQLCNHITKNKKEKNEQIRNKEILLANIKWRTLYERKSHLKCMRTFSMSALCCTMTW